jgi:tRNA A37 threonylcarbamoyladenosine biosynthesis protein TsaE
MYRLESEDEARAVGFETYFDTATLDGHTIVEWAQNTQGLLPKSYMQITLEKIDDDQRKITVEQIGE